jgi:hypothetical protein
VRQWCGKGEHHAWRRPLLLAAALAIIFQASVLAYDFKKISGF